MHGRGTAIDKENILNEVKLGKLGFYLMYYSRFYIVSFRGSCLMFSRKMTMYLLNS